MKKIDLEKIILDEYGCKSIEEVQRCFDISVVMIKNIAKEACRQTLLLAAEKSEFYTWDTIKECAEVEEINKQFTVIK